MHTEWEGGAGAGSVLLQLYMYAALSSVYSYYDDGEYLVYNYICSLDCSPCNCSSIGTVAKRHAHC